MVIQRRPHCSATKAVVPEPQVGSSTRSPGSVVMRRQRSIDLRAASERRRPCPSAKPHPSVSVPDVVDREDRKVIDEIARIVERLPTGRKSDRRSRRLHPMLDVSSSILAGLEASFRRVHEPGSSRSCAAATCVSVKSTVSAPSGIGFAAPVFGSLDKSSSSSAEVVNAVYVLSVPLESRSCRIWLPILYALAMSCAYQSM